MVDYSNFTIHPRAAAPYVSIEGETLRDVYGTYSSAKEAAYDYCMDLCNSVGGTWLGITSHNTFSFTAAFEFVNENNGRDMRAIITPTYNHAYYI